MRECCLSFRRRPIFSRQEAVIPTDPDRPVHILAVMTRLGGLRIACNRR